MTAMLPSHCPCSGPDLTASPRARVLLALCVLAVAFGRPSPARAAPSKRTVAVLYFDNNTGDRKLDVLQKCFADMIVTDLSSVRGLTVVERERLQKLLQELKLQRSRYFNKRTALRLGKGLGARYVVTGAFAAIRPTLRIDMRMIDVSTSKIVLATKVVGKQTDLFKLEQQLVRRFVSRLALTFRTPARPRTKVPHVRALLAYSRGIDLADKGKLKAAQLRLATTVRLAPLFALARIRKSEIMKRLARSASRRRFVIGQRGRELYRNAQKYLKSHKAATAPAAEVRTLLAYRVIEGWFAARALRAHLSAARGLKVVMHGHAKQARRLIKSYVASRAQLVKELAIYGKRFTKVLANGYRYLSTSYRLPTDDAQRARQASFVGSLGINESRAKMELARFLLMGVCSDGSRRNIMFGPIPASSNRRYARLGMRLLDEVVRHEEALLKSKAPGRNDYLAIQAAELAGDALLLRGKRKAAITKWQGILDRHPTSSSYKRVEQRIKRVLGVTRYASRRGLARYATGLKGCQDMDLRVGLGAALQRRLRVSGLAGIMQTVKEVERRCGKNPAARRFFEYLFSHAALAAGRHGHCKLFDALMKRYVRHGGHQGSVAAYRKNYTSCP